jgi:aspartyl-tRNA(Asn)/glutamyl-tRNA(Gln) amidotransferase subunit C
MHGKHHIKNTHRLKKPALEGLCRKEPLYLIRGSCAACRWFNAWDDMITREDVQHIGWLASIKIEDEEKDELVEHFNTILEYFEQLDEVDTEGVEPTYRVVDLANIFREDAAYESLSQEQALKNAPRRENGYFKSPRIV